MADKRLDVAITVDADQIAKTLGVTTYDLAAVLAAWARSDMRNIAEAMNPTNGEPLDLDEFDAEIAKTRRLYEASLEALKAYDATLPDIEEEA